MSILISLYVLLGQNLISCLIVPNASSTFLGEDYRVQPDFKIVLTLKNPRQTISSPGFPDMNYPANTQILYEVELKVDDGVKQLSNRILLTFEMFSLQDSEFCTKDGLEIADSSNQVRVYCGPQVGRTILSEGSKLYIRFFSDASIESRGYSILLQMYNTGCSKHFLNKESGTFTSPNYPGRYYADDICVWKIDEMVGRNFLTQKEIGELMDFALNKECIRQKMKRTKQNIMCCLFGNSEQSYRRPYVPVNKRILVRFEDTFDIRAYEPLCTQDYLAVSLTGDFETHVKRYCHGKKPVSMYSTGNSMLFMFRTDCCFEGKGFSASFTAVEEDEVTPTLPPDPLPQLCTCGTENTDEVERILGGKTVQPSHRYPWVVALVKKLRNNKDDYFCGGALINKQYVLTAAHCIEKETVSETRVAIGAHDSKFDSIFIQAAKFILHPNYRRKIYVNDIALIRLESPIVFNYKASPVCLPTEDGLTSSGSIAVVAGWGVQSFESSVVNTRLQEVKIPIVSNSRCVAKYGGIVLDTNICAGGESGKDACGGDSGGPLFTKHNGKWYAVGLVSWGVSCGREGYPGVYTRVSEYYQWIQDQTKDSPPCDDEVSPPVKPNLENCGISNTGVTERIVGGVEVTPFEFPWMERIQLASLTVTPQVLKNTWREIEYRLDILRATNGAYIQLATLKAMIVYENTVIGAGALINPFYVITAASTFDNTMKWYPELLNIFLGRHTLKGKNTLSMRYTVKSVFQHPEYGTPSPYNNDIALLKLQVPAEGVAETYKPICLPRSDAWYPPELSLTTAGWGSTSNSADGSNVLMKVDLNAWTEEECQQRYPEWFTENMLCAYKTGADTCHGDSGAPLMRFYYGRYYLAGLSSWASKNGCAVKNAPRVFSAVHANLNWISNVTGLDVM